MKVLVIGSGGREHAICRTFARSGKVGQLFCANGNGGIAEVAECIPFKPDDIAGLTVFAAENGIDLTFVGGETSLALGVVDEFERRSLRIVGPNRDASRLEASKSFAKDFMSRHGVPAARSVAALSAVHAIAELESGSFGDEQTPVVIKADGLAAGKGVVVAANRSEAIAAVSDLESLVGAAAAGKIVIEECLLGKEVSLLMFADGEDFALMPPTRDHKRIGEGDTGPNTGGMGTVTDSSILSDTDLQTVIQSIIRPTLRGCVDEGFRFRGILFLGLMMTAEGPKLLEYNVRFGDPETQAILVRLKTDLFEICESMLDGRLAETPIDWKPGSSACVVLASKGYPLQPQTGDPITGIIDAENIENLVVFHAGTSMTPAKGFQTSGGRVLGVTATGNDLEAALATAYSGVEKIRFEGMQFRKDIGK